MEITQPIMLALPSTVEVLSPAASVAPVIQFALRNSNAVIRCTYGPGAGPRLGRSHCDVPVGDNSLLDAVEITLDPGGSATVKAAFKNEGPAPRARPNNRAELEENSKDPSRITPVTVVPDPNAVTSELKQALARAARANREVASLLGERNAFVSVSGVDLEKNTDIQVSAEYALEFVSHTHRKPVIVLMNGTDVLSTQYTDKWPHASTEEEALAIKLALSDPRLPPDARAWDARGMGLAANYPVDTGHRVIDIRFGPLLGKVPSTALYYAAVDVTDEKVLVLEATP